MLQDDVIMQDGEAGLTASQEAYLNAVDDDRLEDGLATGPVHGEAWKEVCVSADATGKNDSSDGDSSDEDEEDDEEEQRQTLIKTLIEECDSENYKCKSGAAVLWVDNIDLLTKAGYKSIMEVADDKKKINKGYVVNLLKDLAAEAADKQLGIARQSTQSQDYFEQSEEDEEDEDAVGEVPISEMSVKKLTEMLNTKQAEKELFEEQSEQGGPVKAVLKQFAAEMKAADKTSQGKASMQKMKELLANKVFKELDSDELALLSKLCNASARKIELPGIIISLQSEIESINKARDLAVMAEAKAKQRAKDTKGKEAAKRKMQAEASSSKARKR